MLRLFETFLESAPQLVLQLYILAYNRNFDKDKDWLTAFAACISLVSLSTSLVSYSKALRDASVNKVSMSWWAFGCQLCWRLSMVASRVIVLVLFASVYKYWILLVIGLHWFFMTILVKYQGTSLDMGKNEILKWLFYAIIGFIYIFCFFNLQDGNTRTRLIFFYSVIFIEDAVLMGFWFPYKHEYGVVFVAAVVMVFGGFCLGLIAMLLYYQCYHPTLSVQGICARMRRCICCEECFSVRRSSNEVSEEGPFRGYPIDVDIPASRGSVGRSVSKNRNPHASPTFETELFSHHPSELQRQYSLDKHRKKVGKEKVLRLHELENGVAKETGLDHGVRFRPDHGVENGFRPDHGVENGSSLSHGVENGFHPDHGVENGSSLDHGVKNGSSLNHGVENGSSLDHGVENGSSLGHGVENGSSLDHKVENSKNCEHGNNIQHSVNKAIAIDICRIRECPEVNGGDPSTRRTCDGLLHCGPDDVEETGTSRLKSKNKCDNGLHCGTDDEQETGESGVESKKESDGLHCGVDRSRTGIGQSKSKMPCGDGLHCGTDDEQETGPSASKKTSGELHCGTHDVKESTKGEHKLKLCRIQNPKYSLNVNFQHRYSIVSDCISLSSSSSDSDEASKEVAANPSNPQCIDEFETELNTKQELKDDNDNFETTLLAQLDNAQSPGPSHSSTAQRLLRKSKQANRVSFPNFVATSLKRGRFSSLRASSETFAEEMKTKRHTVDLSDLASGGESEKNCIKGIQRFKPTQFGSVREQLEQLKDSSDEKTM